MRIRLRSPKNRRRDPRRRDLRHQVPSPHPQERQGNQLAPRRLALRHPQALAIHAMPRPGGQTRRPHRAVLLLLHPRVDNRPGGSVAGLLGQSAQLPPVAEWQHEPPQLGHRIRRKQEDLLWRLRLRALLRRRSTEPDCKLEAEGRKHTPTVQYGMV
jgi:hypothetical protein